MSHRIATFAAHAAAAALLAGGALAQANELEAPPVLPSISASDSAVDDRRSSVLFGQPLPRGFLPGFDRGLTTASDATADTAANRPQSRTTPERRLFDQRRPLTYMNNLLRIEY